MRDAQPLGTTAKLETVPLTMQDLKDKHGATQAEAAAMIRFGLELVAMGARLYSAFLHGEIT